MDHNDNISHTQSDMNNITLTHLRELKEQNDRLLEILIDIDTRTDKTEEQLGSINKFVPTLCDNLNRIQAQVKQNSEEIRFLKQRVLELEIELEKGEESRVKLNLLFYGINEKYNQKENCVDTINDILCAHYSVNEWEGVSGITNAFRLGRQQRSSNSPRPILVTFSSWKNVMIVLKDKQGRDALKSNGVSVSQQKTKRQQNTLQVMRSQGRIGFFHRGQLFEKKGGRAVRCRDFDLETNQKKRRGNSPPRFGQSEQEVVSDSQVNQPDAKRDTPSTSNLNRTNEATSKRQCMEPLNSNKTEGEATVARLVEERIQYIDDLDAEQISKNSRDTLTQCDHVEDQDELTKKQDKAKTKAKIQAKMKELGLWKNGLIPEKCLSPKPSAKFHENTVVSITGNKQTSSEKVYPISNYF